MLFSLLLPAGPAIGQAPYKHLQGCADTTNTAVVSGRILSESKRQPSSGHHVLLEGADYCFAVPDSLGRFEFSQVKPGGYRLLITGASPGFRPIELDVVAGDTVTLMAEVYPDDVVGECQVFVPCRNVLEPRPVSTLTPDVDPLVEAGLRTAVAVAWTKMDLAWERIPCFRNAEPSIVAQLRLRVPTAVSAEDCDADWTSLPSPKTQVIHRASGRRAYSLEFRLLDRTETRGEGLVTVSVAPLWRAEWQCYYRLGMDGWELTNCTLLSIS